MYCMPGGRPFVDKLKHVAKDAQAVIAWGSCASWGCVQAAKPNPTTAVPINRVITDKPIIKVPGCPPIGEVMAGTIVHLLAFGTIPELDRVGRPKAFYSRRVHDTCYRRPNYDAGLFVESWDDENARKGYCLYKMGCRGPVTYNACAVTKWNNGVSFPIQSGHGCIGCSEENFWDNGPFYNRLTNLPGFGIESTADQVGAILGAATAAGLAGHAALTFVRKRDVVAAHEVPETPVKE
jgi:hydrogenase small subunit